LAVENIQNLKGKPKSATVAPLGHQMCHSGTFAQLERPLWPLCHTIEKLGPDCKTETVAVFDIGINCQFGLAKTDTVSVSTFPTVRQLLGKKDTVSLLPLVQLLDEWQPTIKLCTVHNSKNRIRHSLGRSDTVSFLVQSLFWQKFHCGTFRFSKKWGEILASYPSWGWLYGGLVYAGKMRNLEMPRKPLAKAVFPSFPNHKLPTVGILKHCLPENSNCWNFQGGNHHLEPPAG
jgi:hypothetical protein